MKKHLILYSVITFQVFLSYSAPKKKELFLNQSVKLIPLSINTPKSDFGPALIGDNLYFSSFGQEQSKKTQKNNFYDLFSSKIDPAGYITGQRQRINEFITQYHDGPVSWCDSTKELFITQSNYQEAGAVFNPFRKNYYNLRIIIARQENGIWKKMENFPYNNPKYSVGHPAISASGDTLIFSSNQPGGYGETDLYMSIRKDGKWGTPKNLGSRINTPQKDEFPYLTNRGFIIYASSGRNGLGGLDLYFTKLNDPSAEVNHFEAPINSQYDDFSMILSPNKEYGYLTSDRPGQGEDDIYEFTFEQYKKNFLALLVMDAKSGKPIPNAEVSFNDYSDLLTGTKGEVSRQVMDDLSIEVNVKAIGYNNGSKVIKTGVLESGQMVKDTILLDMIVRKNIVLKNIYYDYDKFDLLPEATQELDKLVLFMNENPEIKVNLSSHTDSRGSEAYNQKLSEKRMESVVNYMNSKGIGNNRVSGKGYGETMPLNKCVDMVLCSPQEFRMNRRTEFFIPEFGKSESVDQGNKGDFTTEPAKSGKVTSSLKKGGKFSVIVGAYTDLPNARKISRQLQNEGYASEIIPDPKLFKVGVNFKDLKTAQETLSKLKIKYPGAWIL